MEDITHLVGHVLEHSIEDTLYLIPFLFVTYLAMEWLEHKAGDKAEEAVRRAGAAGPVVGAVVGIVPQCGFSAAAATLWAGRVITLGTLFAVFLSTSDEMLPIFLAEQVDPMTIVKIMGVKLMIGMIMGFVVDAAVRLARRDREKLRISTSCASATTATATANATPASRTPSLPTITSTTRSTNTITSTAPSCAAP